MASRRHKPYFLVLYIALVGGCQSNPYQQGQVIYDYHCGNCHMADGSGLGQLIPPLDASSLSLHDPQRLICLIRQGLPLNTTTGQQMPANHDLSATEMTNLINFLGLRYKGWPQTVKEVEVSHWLQACDAR